MILAADVGGTKTNVAFFELENDHLVALDETRYPSRDFASLDELALKFLSDHQRRADFACFGIAGPCRDGVCDTTNLPWHVDARRLRDEMQVQAALVINDLEATAYAVDNLPRDQWATLKEGTADPLGNAAVIAAGTGLGEAGMFSDGVRRRPFACEGGHSDFAPRSELETELLLFLKTQFGHVAWERILSGAGLKNLYDFFCWKHPSSASTEIADQVTQAADPAAVITRAATTEQCEACGEALKLFASLYGAEAGNLALKMMATGGVFVGGGIAPRILTSLQDGSFADSFTRKGRLESVLQEIPVRVMLSNRAALLGAAQCARLHSEAC